MRRGRELWRHRYRYQDCGLMELGYFDEWNTNNLNFLLNYHLANRYSRMKVDDCMNKQSLIF